MQASIWEIWDELSRRRVGQAAVHRNCGACGGGLVHHKEKHCICRVFYCKPPFEQISLALVLLQSSLIEPSWPHPVRATGCL